MKPKKYRGIYDKCRTCKHAKIVGMVIIFVEDSCLGDVKQVGDTRYTYKHICQSCGNYEKREVQNEKSN